MSNTELTKEQKEAIDHVLFGRNPSWETEDNITPHMVEKFLVLIGWERGELDTNGWQYDWWLPFTKDGKSFTASGSGYYGGFAIHKTDE